MAPEILLIRADASPQIGTGHIMRCLALAQVWKEGGREALFVSAEPVPALSERLATEGIRELQLRGRLPGSLEDAKETAAAAKKNGARWIVIDGYHFGDAYQAYLKDAGYNLLVWDDNGRSDHYFANFIINQNIHAESNLYARKEPYTQLLLGTKYAVLRSEFLSWRDWKREIPLKAKNILVTMGGSDPDNVTLRVIQALQQIEGDKLQVVVVVGGSNPHYPSLKAAVESTRDWIQLQCNVSDMPALMAWADLAISAAGSTCWELAFMGLPSLLLVLAENQESIANHLHNNKVAVHLGSGRHVCLSVISAKTRSLIGDHRLRAELSSRGTQLIDGLGAQRVILALDESR